MKKITIFVEGQTEQIFVERLITEIAGAKNVDIELKKSTGGRFNNRKIITIKRVTPTKQFYVLIIDSCNDERVQTDIRDRLPQLKAKGYSKVIGLRDLYPKKLEDLDKMIKYSERYINNPNIEINSKIIFAVMEVETWFLKEYTYLSKIDSKLVKEFIINKLGYDLENDSLEENPKYYHPAKVLDEIYKLVGRRYDKTKKKVNKLVESLDYEKIYFQISKELISLNIFIKELDGFFE